MAEEDRAVRVVPFAFKSVVRIPADEAEYERLHRLFDLYLLRIEIAAELGLSDDELLVGYEKGKFQA